MSKSFRESGNGHFVVFILDESCHLVDTCALMKVVRSIPGCTIFSGHHARESDWKFTSHAKFERYEVTKEEAQAICRNISVVLEWSIPKRCNAIIVYSD